MKLFALLYLYFLSATITAKTLSDVVKVHDCPENLDPFGDWKGVISVTGFALSGLPSRKPIQPTTVYICTTNDGMSRFVIELYYCGLVLMIVISLFSSHA
jgi:hypothetical protein